MGASEASNFALTFFQIIGTIAFAISGALVAGSQKMDWFGVVVLAVLVAVGGGSVRDLLLDAPVFWVETPWYVLLAAVTALLTIPLTRLHINKNYQNYLRLSDSIGLAVFAILGAEKALDVGTNAFAAIIMGVITGVVGGILRDVIANRDPSILYGDFYASAALLGCIVFVLLQYTSLNSLNTLWISIGVIFVARLVAVIQNWSLPEFSLQEKNEAKID